MFYIRNIIIVLITFTSVVNAHCEQNYSYSYKKNPGAECNGGSSFAIVEKVRSLVKFFQKIVKTAVTLHREKDCVCKIISPETWRRKPVC